MTFEDLKFQPRQHLGGVHAHAFFPNGYGASIVQGPGTYGGTTGLYELAVVRGTDASAPLCYDTPVTDDVLGWLSEDGVTAALAAIEALPEVSA